MTKPGLVCAALLLPACILEPTDTSYQPTLDEDALAGFDGHWELDQQSVDEHVFGSLTLARADGLCFLLSTATTVTLDGVPGTIDRGGWYGGDGEWPYNDDHCVSPKVAFDVMSPAEHSTIVASDGTTTWTIDLDRGFVDRRFMLRSPTGDSPAHPDDEIAIELQPAVTLSNVNIRLTTSAGTSYYCDDRSCEPLVLDGQVAHFTLGVIGKSETAKLLAGTTMSLPIQGCDIPGGCTAKSETVTHLDLAVEPQP